MKTNLKRGNPIWRNCGEKKMKVTVNFKVFLGLLKLSNFNATFLGFGLKGGLKGGDIYTWATCKCVSIYTVIKYKFDRKFT